MASELTLFHRDRLRLPDAPIQQPGCPGTLPVLHLGDLVRLRPKSIDPIDVGLSGTARVSNRQRFTTDWIWGEGLMKAIQQKNFALKIGAQDPERTMLTIDLSEFPKKGGESVGVTRQYCGTRGNVDNWQSGVFLGFLGERVTGSSTPGFTCPGNGSLRSPCRPRLLEQVPDRLRSPRTGRRK
ncbi:MAG: transposase [Leptospirales bacterium]